MDEATFNQRVMAVLNFINQTIPDSEWMFETDKLMYKMHRTENMFILAGSKSDLLQLGLEIVRFAGDPLNKNGSHFHIDNSKDIASDTEIMIELIPDSPDIKEAK